MARITCEEVGLVIDIGNCLHGEAYVDVLEQGQVVRYPARRGQGQTIWQRFSASHLGSQVSALDIPINDLSVHLVAARTTTDIGSTGTDATNISPDPELVMVITGSLGSTINRRGRFVISCGGPQFDSQCRTPLNSSR